jgi:hypothetical protein
MKSSLQRVLTLGFVVTTLFSSFALAGPKVKEELSFEIKKLSIIEQGPQVVDMKVRVRYIKGIQKKDYPDFEIVYKDLVAMMKNYPDKTDYLEIFNKNLSLELLKKYPGYGAVTLDLTFNPTEKVPYSQTSHCTAER